MRTLTRCAAFAVLLSTATGQLLSPTVDLDYATFHGRADALTGTKSFLGMPFAVAGRLQNPRVIGAQDKLKGVQDATQYGDACPQAELTASPLYSGNAEIGSLLSITNEKLAALAEQLTIYNFTRQSEDCLSINVQMPANIPAGKQLPVVFWIHGGGFELGSSSALGLEQTGLPGIFYQGANIVRRSVEMGQPVVFVSANHRLNGFGTLASQELTDAGLGNLLLKDQRTAMRWTQKYISKFGGDPTKVTLMGESAGSQAIATHMLLNNGDTEGLFRAAIMMSGGPSKFSDYHRGQSTFDGILSRIGCGNASNKIRCFRNADYSAIYRAIQTIPNFFSYLSTAVPWYPRPDGKYLVDSPHRLLREGSVARIPYIIGDMRDEGTLFSLVNQLNITAEAEFRNYFNTVFFPEAPASKIAQLASFYPTDPAAGSPFGTGDANALTPMYKRLAALTGDYTFQAGRRDLLERTASKQPAWTYVIDNDLPVLGTSPLLNDLGVTNFPALGSFHVSDVVLYAFGTVPEQTSKNTLDIMSTFIAFANSLDPNNHGLQGLPKWPRWDRARKAMFNYREQGARIIKDNYREKAMRFINDNADYFLS